MLAYLPARQSFRHGNGGGERVDVVGRDEAARTLRDQLGYAAPIEGDNRCAATHSLGNHQPVRFIPHRGDQRDRRGPDQPCQIVLGEMPGVVDIGAEVGLNTLGVIAPIGDRARQRDGARCAAGGFDREMGGLFRGDSSEPHDAVAARPQWPAPGVDSVGHQREPLSAVHPRPRGVLRHRGKPRPLPT